MTETPQARIDRLQNELADAKVDALEKELAEAKAAAAGGPQSAVDSSSDADAAPVSAWIRAGSSWTTAPEQTAGPATGAGEPLAPAPRAVPFAFRTLVMPWSWRITFILFMISVAPIALWIFMPIAGAVVGAATFLAVVVIRVRRTHLVNTLLRWGEVAAVTDSQVLEQGTYYSGTTYQNARMAQAHGWQVERSWYSGPATKTRISYRVRDKPGTLDLHGLPYDDGVILADPRAPERALCVSSIPVDLARGPDGNWRGHVGARVAMGSVAMTLLLLGWTTFMVVVFTMAASSLGTLVRH